MSGFTRDTRHYGDRLVYEALGSKWARYHARCGCGQDWVAAHAEPAGFSVVRRGSGFVALVGPGLTENVDEAALTTDALFTAVTGTPSGQGWSEPVRIIDRSPQAELVRKADSERVYQARQQRSDAANKEPLTAAQRSYLSSLITKVSRERLDAELGKIRGVPDRLPDQTSQQRIDQLTKAAARKLITALKS